ncbi:MAG: histidine phosphatase family protein [Actinobacteria bacterium]|nr:histidine phosphatase family protein [Actinomycetota bacterium]
MTLYVLRHARAGRRSAWKRPDELRPLTKVGRRQSAGVVELLADRSLDGIVSSPYVRCVQSVEPLAADRDMKIEVSDALAEGVGIDDVLGLVHELADDDVVLCTHGDVLRLLLEHVRGEGVKVRRRNGAPPMEKGSVWELEIRKRAVIRATYHRPPPPAAK